MFLINVSIYYKNGDYVNKFYITQKEENAVLKYNKIITEFITKILCNNDKNEYLNSNLDDKNFIVEYLRTHNTKYKDFQINMTLNYSNLL